MTYVVRLLDFHPDCLAPFRNLVFLHLEPDVLDVMHMSVSYRLQQTVLTMRITSHDTNDPPSPSLDADSLG